MKPTSSPLTHRLLRHLRHLRHHSTTATTTATTTSSTITVSKAKHKLLKEHDPDKALEIYSSLSDNYSSPVSSRYAQELTVTRLAKARRFDDIDKLIESHLKSPNITHEPFFCTLIRCYGKAGMFEKALALYERMETFGTVRSCLSFNALLVAGNNCRVYDNVRQLFDEMPKRYGFEPDEVSYGILIKAYCELGEAELGLGILRGMEEKGVEVTAVSFTTVLDALYKKGNVEEAERVWGELVGKGGGCVVDVAAWNVRIGNVHGESPENVKGLIEEMSGAGLKPDTISYNYLLTCYCKNGRMDEAMKLYEELEASGFRSKAATFRTLVHYLCRNEDYGRGYEVFKRSVFHNKIPDFATLKVLVEGLVKKKMKKDAKGLIRTVKKKFPPNLLNAWKKVEVELGLVSDDVSVGGDVSEVAR